MNNDEEEKDIYHKDETFDFFYSLKKKQDLETRDKQFNFNEKKNIYFSYIYMHISLDLFFIAYFIRKA